MKIDAHQHFWTYEAQKYPWITEALSRLCRDFLPAALERDLANAGLDGSIAVQARRVTELARRNPFSRI